MRSDPPTLAAKYAVMNPLRPVCALGTSPKGRGKAACGGKQSDKLKFEAVQYFTLYIISVLSAIARAKSASAITSSSPGIAAPWAGSNSSSLERTWASEKQPIDLLRNFKFQFIVLFAAAGGLASPFGRGAQNL